jgi:hypothetical protein
MPGFPDGASGFMTVLVGAGTGERWCRVERGHPGCTRDALGAETVMQRRVVRVRCTSHPPENVCGISSGGVPMTIAIS